MSSPFPGMNPYLEQEDVWQDFHDSMLPAIRDALAPQVSPDYIVKIEQHLFIHEPPAEQRFLVGHADVSLARPNGATELAGATATISSPSIGELLSVDFEKLIYLEIRDRRNRELVTVLEMLSPCNKKPGADREQYLVKRVNLLRSSAHFVEIDLLRGWQKMPMKKSAEGDYAIMVSRAEDRPKVNHWLLGLRDSLPKIPIPLRPPHANAELDLQAVLHGVYDRAKYQDYIYHENPYPPLSPKDAAWALSVIRSSTSK